MSWSSQDSIWPGRAWSYLLALLYAWSRFQLLLHVPQHVPDLPPPCWAQRVSGWGGKKEGDAHWHIFISLHSRPFWFCGCWMIWKETAQLCARDLPQRCLSQSWENTLFSCKHQHIINTKPVFIPSSLKLHNSCNNRLPHPFIRTILANCCIHPTPSLPQTLCKLLQISLVPARWAFFLL